MSTAGLTHVTLVAVCCVALLACGREGAAATFTVRPEHPRLLVTRGDLPRLQTHAAAYPELWERVKGAALRAPEDPGYGDARALRSAALVYLLTREQRYLDSAVALAGNIARHPVQDRYAAPEALFSLALGYDWCYDALTPAQRAEYARGMLALADYLDKEVWRHSDFNNHFVLEKVWPFTYAGLALHGDVADPRVKDYLTRAEGDLHQHVLPAANLMAGHSGGQFEGYGYDLWGYARPMAFVFEAWRTATGEDLFAKCTATRNFALWNIYGRRPTDAKQEHFDDADLDASWGAEDTYAYLIAARHRDGYAQWMGDQIPPRYDSPLWQTILWRDPKLAPTPPTDLPTARHFDALGWVLMRSDWGKDATFASFQCGPFWTGHQHLDNNSFTLHKRGLLAIDPGINAYGESIDDGYRTNYYSRSIAHNTILVLDPKEKYSGGAWAGGDGPAANDGGQFRVTGPERVEEVKPGDRWAIGELRDYAHAELYTYAVGDATKSYAPAKLERFVRHFLFLPPNLFVIFDEVVAKEAGFRKTWVLHTVNEPKVTGALLTVTEGEGQLVCRTVLPEAATATVVGGPGKECWVDGKNWPSLEKKEWPPEAGSWRVEISPSRPAKEDRFLHVLQAGENDISAADAVTRIGATGVRIRAQRREYEVSFAKGKCHLTIREGGKTVVERALP